MAINGYNVQIVREVIKNVLVGELQNNRVELAFSGARIAVRTKFVAHHLKQADVYIVQGMKTVKDVQVYQVEILASKIEFTILTDRNFIRAVGVEC